MPAFNPETRYDITTKDFPIREFAQYEEEFVVRPPYQRKNVWSRGKQQALLDSLFRRYYVPRIVLREVRLSDEKTIYEVIDGQQRINTVQRFIRDDLRLPDSLSDVHPDLPGTYFSDLPADIRRFVDRDLIFTADIVKRIADPENPDHIDIATDIFWRLQQGETLNYMEIAHSRLSSLVRNFIVKYADDQSFDFQSYKPLDSNTSKHKFFDVVARGNNRMQHLALLTRFLILEENDGPTDIKEKEVKAYIDDHEDPDGIGNYEFEDSPEAKAVLRYMDLFYEIFQDDPMVQSGDGIQELKTEYFIISAYLLLRHLDKHYVFEDKEKELFRDFVLDFHDRWKERKEDDRDILIFADNRQQSGGEIEVRDRVIRQLFFEYTLDKGYEMLTKDDRRGFSEAERIKIYRRDDGLCQMCLEEGLPEKEAQVPWSEYEADHVVPHVKGGPTDIENAQVLCERHNREKGARSL